MGGWPIRFGSKKRSTGRDGRAITIPQDYTNIGMLIIVTYEVCLFLISDYGRVAHASVTGPPIRATDEERRDLEHPVSGLQGPVRVVWRNEIILWLRRGF